ncbi:hypothetical protein LTR62_004123 [Meristemomyces frigidus]|uniref:Uncharacterized protein n=1 Tax=Meristemomyces frigidus TaxID=1508187 RepID=A0AAN7TPP0_9PEZI|nr:hypothetical protein LTR62_004123 [Meristemomyces frigidus]
MQRRSTARTTERRRYTVDAFAGVPELAHVVSEDDEEDAPIHRHEDSAASEGSDESEDLAGLDDFDDESRVQPQTPHPKTKRASRPKSTLTRVNAGKDTAEVAAAKRVWARDLTLPSRHEDADGYGGFHHSFIDNNDAQHDEARRAWERYADSGCAKVFEDYQALNVLGSKQSAEHIVESQACDFVMGPAAEQKLFHLHTQQSLSLERPWSRTGVPHAETNNDSTSDERSGFMVNLGGRVQCLEWVSAQRGSSQYLTALVAPIIGHEVADPDAGDNSSNIQIWCLEADVQGRVDNTMPPRLAVVLRYPWAGVRMMQWCSTHRRPSEIDIPNLLAIIAEDGVLRVCGVPLDLIVDDTEYKLLEKSLELRVANCLCTCIAWLSPTRITAGYSDGRVRIWDLSQVQTGEMTPIKTIRAHNSYITSIVAKSSDVLTQMVVVALSGKITHISYAETATRTTGTVSQINHMTMPILIYHEFLQRVISYDDDGAVYTYTLPGSGRPKIVAKANGLITSMASSPCHPCILIGTADGKVISANPLQADVRSKQGTWQQKWFTHEWRAASHNDVRNNTNSACTENPSGKALSRILEGYKAECVDSVAPTPFRMVEGKTAITALAWNPNIHVGGWAAAGMGGGLVRIEDIAV